jgi:hypothetical protein
MGRSQASRERMRGGMSRVTSKNSLFCRKTQPVWLGFALRVIGKIKRALMPPGKSQAARHMGAG